MIEPFYILILQQDTNVYKIYSFMSPGKNGPYDNETAGPKKKIDVNADKMQCKLFFFCPIAYMS